MSEDNVTWLFGTLPWLPWRLCLLDGHTCFLFENAATKTWKRNIAEKTYTLFKFFFKGKIGKLNEIHIKKKKMELINLLLIFFYDPELADSTTFTDIIFVFIF